MLGELLVGSGQVTSLQVVKALGAQFGMYVEPRVEHYDIDPSLVGPLSLSYARDSGVLPVRIENGVLEVALSNPLAVDALDDLRVIFEPKRIDTFLVTH